MNIKSTGLSDIEVAVAVDMFAHDNLTEGNYALHEVERSDGASEYLKSIDKTLENDEEFLVQMEHFIMEIPDGDEWTAYALASYGEIQGIIAFSDWQG